MVRVIPLNNNLSDYIKDIRCKVANQYLTWQVDLFDFIWQLVLDEFKYQILEQHGVEGLPMGRFTINYDNIPIALAPITDENGIGEKPSPDLIEHIVNNILDCYGIPFYELDGGYSLIGYKHISISNDFRYIFVR